MVYEGKPYPKRGKRKKRTRVKIETVKSGTKLLVCLWVLFLAILIKFVFPSTAANIQETVLTFLENSVDYSSAVRVLGEAVSGEKDFLEAISQAYNYAFRLSSDEVEVYAQSEDIDVVDDDIPESELYYNVPSDAQETEVDKQEIYSPDIQSGDETEDEHVAEQENDNFDDAVSAFIESQELYAHLGVPENVTYDKPELDIDSVVPVIGTVTSHFGYRDHPVEGEIIFHYGTDIGADKGQDVLAFADGSVYAVGDSSSYGLYIILQHDNGIETLYAHLDSVDVEGGDSISKGEKIGSVGDSGNATGPCLHFELMQNEIYLNPEYYVQWK